MSTKYNPRNLIQREASEDVKLLSLALNELWPVSADARKKLIDRQMEIINNPIVAEMTRALAARNVLAAGALNLKAIALMREIQGTIMPASTEEPDAVASTQEIAEGLEALSGHRQFDKDTWSEPATVAAPSDWQSNAG